MVVKQEGKLKPPPNMPKKQMEDSKFEWKKEPSATCECCGNQGDVSKDCYYHMREDNLC
jgi:hypothetical protein